MSSREVILQRLRQARRPFPQPQGESEPVAVSPLGDVTQGQLLARFMREAEALSCQVERVENGAAAARAIIAALEGAQHILAWDLEQIPCIGLGDALKGAGVTIAAADDDSAAVGLTGAQAAVAASGSLVLVSGRGRPRTAALLPRKNIAVITPDQILPHLEAWLAIWSRQTTFQEAASVMIVSGPSRTADIAMEPILGMHGPAVLHIMIIEERAQGARPDFDSN